MPEVERHAITDPAFFAGGNAHFTVENPAGERYTFRVRMARDGKIYFLSLLTGSDNNTDYTYLAVYQPQDGQVRKTRKSPSKSQPIEIAQWAFDVVWGRLPLKPGYSILHEGRCCRCGRRLTVPESIRTGIGPECAEKMPGGAYWAAFAGKDKKEQARGLRGMIAKLESEVQSAEATRVPSVDVPQGPREQAVFDFMQE